MIKLLIDEEYGFRTWLAELTQENYAQLLQRWETMRGLNCLVPVPLIVPQAVRISDEELIAMLDRQESFFKCHIHEHDDSYLEGSSYEIPPEECFWMEDKRYKQYY